MKVRAVGSTDSGMTKRKGCSCDTKHTHGMLFTHSISGHRYRRYGGDFHLESNLQ